MKPSNLMNQIVDSFRKRGLITEHFPMVISGVPSGWIHSLAISHLIILGHRLGLISIADVGILERAYQILSDEPYQKRPDPVWIDPIDHRIIMVAEIESTDMTGKARNLVLFSRHVESAYGHQPELSCLIWAGRWDEEEWKESRNILCHGFRSGNSRFPKPSHYLLVMNLLFQKTNDERTYLGARIIDLLKLGTTRKKELDLLRDRLTR